MLDLISLTFGLCELVRAIQDVITALLTSRIPSSTLHVCS